MTNTHFYLNNGKMSEINPINLHSEEVQEIISHVPNGLLRWGSLLFSL